MTRQDRDEERAHEEREARSTGPANPDRVARHLAVAETVSPKQNACRNCGGFGTVPYRKRYHADTVRIPCPECQP